MSIICSDSGPVGRPGRFLGREMLVPTGSVSDLARVIPAPGPQGAVRFKGHRVIPTRSDSGPAGRRGRFLGGLIGLTGGGSVA